MPTILLADDDEFLRYILATTLRRSGWTVLESGDGAQTLRAATASAPDLVALDVSIPGMDGYSVCRALRENPRTSRIPVLLMSEGPPDLHRLAHPPDDCIAKPFQLADIVRKVEVLARSSAAIAATERREHGCLACDLKVEVLMPDEDAGERLSEGTLIVLSLRGGLLAFPGLLRQGAACVIRLTMPAAVALPCRVRREAGASGVLRYYGVSFDLSPEQEETLSRVMETLAAQES